MPTITFAASVRTKAKVRPVAIRQKTLPDIIHAVKEVMEYAEGRLAKEVDHDDCNLRRVVGHSSVVNFMSVMLSTERKRLNLRPLR